MTGLPFPLIEVDQHPSGCDDECDFPLHLTPAGLDTLRVADVPSDVVDAALAGEARAHEHRRTYPRTGPAGWNQRIEMTLTALGVADSVIEAAREKVQAGERKRANAAVRAASTRADADAAMRDRVARWKAANKARVAQHSRDYRARRSLRGRAELEIVK